MTDAKSLFGLSNRLPPMNLDAERALLGAILSNNRAYERVADYLLPEHFADPVNAAVYARATERILDGYLADAVTLHSDMEGSGALDEVGGTAYLARLLGAMVGITMAGEYGRAVHDAWLRRQLVEVGQNIVHNAFGIEGGVDAEKQIEIAQRALGDLNGADSRKDRIVSLGAAVSSAIAQASAIYAGAPSPALLSGMPTVDRAFGGFWPRNFILLAGIPGAGKTALATQIAFRIALRLYDKAIAAGAKPVEAYHQPGVSIFSLEMSAEELGTRIAAERADIPVERLMRGDLDMAVAANLARAERETAFLPMRIHDCRATSLKLLSAKVRLHLQRQPELMVVLDHLLVLESEQVRGRSGGNDAANVAVAARNLKQLAGETGLPFLVLTHATRASAGRTNPRPVMQDVKWAGEGDADVLVFVHRPIMFRDASPAPKGARESDDSCALRQARWYQERDAERDMAELVVAKRRMGASGVYRLRFNGPTTSFGEFSVPDDDRGFDGA